MSVNAGDRIEGKLEVLVKARKLASYTIHICCNEKWFPQKYKNAIIDKIVNTATDIFIKCWTANNILVNGDKEKAIKRCRLQVEAHDDCNNLLAMIEIAHEVFHLTSKRMKYWGELIIAVRNLILAWNKSDSKRFDL